MLACSFVVQDGEPTHAPLAFTLPFGEICLACLPRGSMVIRDIDVAHCGTANLLDHARMLPGMRIALRSQLRMGHKPQRNVLPQDFNKWFPTEWLQKVFAYVWAWDDDQGEWIN